MRWLDFTAIESNEQVVLNFSTAQEMNNQKFEIEQSPDGLNFETIGSIAGKGNSDQISHYTFTTSQIPTQVMHYRIKQIDFDGKFDYSKVISFNPTLPKQATIFYASRLNSICFSQLNTIQTVSSLTSGVYLLRISEKDGSVWHKKIWVQK